jgi:hypothetical protein
MEFQTSLHEAIKQGKELQIKIKYNLGGDLEVEFQPYIYGSDTMQHEFAWGFLTHSGLYYKFRLTDIISGKFTGATYKVRPDAFYLYSIEEEFYAVLPNFQNVSSQAELCMKNSGQENGH